MREFYLYKLNNQDSDIEIVYAFKKEKKKFNLWSELLFFIIGLLLVILGIVGLVLTEIENVGTLCLVGVALIMLSFLMLWDYKNKNPYSLTIDAIGFHEKSVTHEQKEIPWEKVCYINFFPDIILDGGKTVQTYGAVVISKAEVTDEERKKYIKKYWRSISKAMSEDSIILCTRTTQARRIYELIAAKAALYGDVTVLKRGTDSLETP